MAVVSNSWVPVILRVDGPYGPQMKKVHEISGYVTVFIQHNIDWLRETGGQKTLLIKIPEAIVQISHRVGPVISFPGKILTVVASALMPLHRLGGCAKNFFAFAEVIIKFSGLWADPERKISYVVMDERGHYFKAQLPLNSWWQRASQFHNFADLSLSISECGTYLWKLQNPDEGSPFASFATWTGRYLSIKDLCFEGWFLYQTWWEGSHLRADNEAKKLKNVILANQELVGSVLKISLSIVCLSIDLFQALAPRLNKPIWLETALFWTRIAPTFITPVARRYWPKLVTQPLYAAAAAG